MTKANANTQYEAAVRDIMQRLLEAQGLTTVTVQHNVNLQGKSREHQIDVYWEFRAGGVTQRVIINCKRYSSTVEVTDVLTLKGVLEDFPGANGVIVTTKGYQAGALEYARYHGIGLKVIRPAQDDDYAGRVRRIRFGISIVNKEVTQTKLSIDESWLKQNSAITKSIQKWSERQDPSRIWVDDRDNGKRYTIKQLIDGLSIRDEPDVERSKSFQWKDAMWEAPELPAIKITGFTITYKLRISPEREIHIGPTFGDMLVKDALAGTLLFIDESGVVTGDTKDESL